MSIAVIQLSPRDAERFVSFRRRMLTEAPWAFGADLEDDFALDAANVRKALATAENAIVAVESPSETSALVATAGILSAASPKFSHRAKLWGVFVAPRHRGSGLGRAVTSAAIDLARQWSGVEFIDLGVSANSPEARALYESLGFEVWGREPETTRIDGRSYDEIFMALRVGGGTQA